MEEGVVATTKTPVRSDEMPRTFQTLPQKRYLCIVMFQISSFKGAVKPEKLIVVSALNNRDGQRWQQRAQRRTRQDLETPPACERTNNGHEEGHGGNRVSDQTNEGYNEGQARSHASNYKHRRGAHSPVGYEDEKI